MSTLRFPDEDLFGGLADDPTVPMPRPVREPAGSPAAQAKKWPPGAQAAALERAAAALKLETPQATNRDAEEIRADTARAPPRGTVGEVADQPAAPGGQTASTASAATAGDDSASVQAPPNTPIEEADEVVAAPVERVNGSGAEAAAPDAEAGWLTDERILQAVLTDAPSTHPDIAGVAAADAAPPVDASFLAPPGAEAVPPIAADHEAPQLAVADDSHGVAADADGDVVLPDESAMNALLARFDGDSNDFDATMAELGLSRPAPPGDATQTARTDQDDSRAASATAADEAPPGGGLGSDASAAHPGPPSTASSAAPVAGAAAAAAAAVPVASGWHPLGDHANLAVPLPPPPLMPVGSMDIRPVAANELPPPPAPTGGAPQGIVQRKAMAAAAELVGLPDGPYKETCVECVVRLARSLAARARARCPCLLSEKGRNCEQVLQNGVLNCRCLNQIGIHMLTTSRVSTVMCASFTNVMGRLQCVKGRRGPRDVPSDALPEGTYSGSCTGCTVTDWMLRCVSCEQNAMRQAHSVVAPLPTSYCAEFENLHGSLECLKMAV